MSDGLDAALSDNERLRRANEALRARMERQSITGTEHPQRAAEAFEAVAWARRHVEVALEASRSALALFTEEGRLIAANRRLAALAPDAAPKLVAGARFDDVVRAIAASAHLDFDAETDRQAWARELAEGRGRGGAPLLARLADGRTIEASERRAGPGAFGLALEQISPVSNGGSAGPEVFASGDGDWPRTTLDRLPIGVGGFDPSGRLTRWNEPFRRLLGLGHGDLAEGVGVRGLASLLSSGAGRRTRREDEWIAPAARLVAWASTAPPRGALQIDVPRGPDLIVSARCADDLNGGFTVSVADVTAERQTAEEVERVRRTLETRVTERTTALIDLNDRLVQEVAERRAIEAEMRRARDAAEAANLSKTRFLAAASHDLLQPLNAAKLFLSALSSSRLSAEAAETVARVESAFSSTEALLSALLDISKLDAGGGEADIREFPVRRVLEPVAEEFGPVAASRGLKLKVARSNALVRSDPHYLRRIVQNLVGNALKYTVRGGVVLGARRRGSNLSIEVWDSGVGVPPAERRRVFEEFHRIETANPRGERGMGLGLAIVERACRLLGHRVDVRSQPGRGSVFAVTAPLGLGDCDAGGSAAADEASPGDAAGMIALVLDDDAAVRRATAELLARWGVDALEVADAAEAVSAVRHLGMAPDVLMLDLHLSDGRTGLEALERLRATLGVRAPALLVTADRSRAVAAAAAAAGAQVLTKPVEPAKLRALLHWAATQPR